MEKMRYWVYDKEGKRVLGPYFASRLKGIPGFGPETKVAPEGSSSREDWRPAIQVPELKELLRPDIPPIPGGSKPK